MASKSRLTVPLARHLIEAGRVTKQDVALYCHSLAWAGEERWGLGAFKYIHSKEHIVEQAEQDGPLAGIPVSVKANLAVKEFPLTASSRILESDCPCGYDAEAVRKLKEAGAIILGVTQMDELGMGSLGTNVGEGLQTKNPLPYLGQQAQHKTLDEWTNEIKLSYDEIANNHTEIVGEEPIWAAGGSSSGSAASVSHGSSLLSLASDTGGSIRLPAAFCGVAGLKPSYGSISRKGLVNYASSLDTVGVLGPTSECVAIALDHLRYTSEEPLSDSTVNLASRAEVSVAGSLNLRIGIPVAFSVVDCSQEIFDSWASAITLLENQGATIEEVSSETVSPDLVKTSIAAYYVLASAEASSNLSRYDGQRYGFSANDQKEKMSGLTLLEQHYSTTRTQGFGREVIRRLLSGASVLSSDRFHTHYEAAAKVRAEVARELKSSLDKVDVLLTPTTLASPEINYIDPTMAFAHDVMTVPFSLAGLASISVPWWQGHLPVGLQVVGEEGKILSVAKALEKANET